MPPWPADGGAAPLKGAQRLSPREFDVLMTWAAGGTPEGPAVAPVADTAPTDTWRLGTPDVVVSMPEPFTLDADQAHAVHEVALPASAMHGRWIRAVDLLPGTPSIVRRAEVTIKGDGREQTLALWLPGDTPQVLEAHGAFKVPARATVIVRIHYRKPLGQDARPVSDRSQVGVYFAAADDARAVRPIEIGIDGDWPFDAARTLTHTVERRACAVALRPISGPTDAAVDLVMIGTDRVRTPLARIRLREDWARRYVFARPVSLPKDSRIEIRVSPSQAILWTTLTGDPPIGPTEGGRLRLALEVVDGFCQ
jgi:hypothetical protein